MCVYLRKDLKSNREKSAKKEKGGERRGKSHVRAENRVLFYSRS